MIGALVAHHLRVLLAARDVLAALLLYGFVVALVALLALHDLPERATVAAAILWLVLALGGLTAAARTLGADAGGGGLRGLFLLPVDRRDLLLARALSSALVAALLGLLTWLVLALLFPDLARLGGPTLLPGLAVGALGTGFVGALTGLAALPGRAGEVMGPVLGAPLLAPLVLAGVHATADALETGAPWDPSLTFAAGYALAVGAIAYLVAEPLSEVGP